MSERTYLGATVIAPVEILSNQPGFQSETIALNTQTVGISAQRWELRFKVQATDPSAYFRQKVSDKFGTKTMVMPQIFHANNEPGHTVTGTVTCTAEAVGQTAITVTAPAAQNGNTIAAGRFIKFSNNDKLYITTSSATFSSGSATFNIFPGLVEATTTSHTLTYLEDSVMLTAYESIENINGITFTDGVLTDSGTIHLIEAL